MLKKLLLGIAVLVVAFVAVVATRPSSYRVERSATFAAAPDIAFGYVNDFHRWAEWSPWGKLDPNQKTTFEGAAAGQGSIYGWSGNDQVGEGRMTVEESKPGELVRIKLEFLKPWQSTNATTFTFKPAAGGTTVTWAMDGHNDFMGKAASLFMDMDGMIGKDFEHGLASMKTLAEAEAKKRAEEEARKVAEAQAAAAAQAATEANGSPATEAQPSAPVAVPTK
jgi:hypothetical protein